jgi:response regulator RpfG family c-di-GMP phosphodiesterase
MTDSTDDKPIRILVVEDDPEDSRLLRELLREVGGGLKVVLAQRLCEAIDLLEHGGFDVVLLDLSLPDAKGLDTLRRTRQKAPGLAIVVLSGLHDDAMALRAVQSGAQDYLVKGEVDGRQITRAIRYAIERQQSEESLRRAREELEARVRERTAELEHVNQALVNKVAEQGEADLQIRILNDQLERRLRRTAALQQIDRAVASSLDPRLTLDIILGHLITQLHVDAADILVCNSNAYMMEYCVGTGFRSDGITRSQVRLGEGWAGRAAMKRCVVAIPNLSQAREPFERTALIADEGFVAYHAFPMVARGQIKGILEVFHRAPLAVDAEFREFVDTISGQAAMALDNATLWEDVQRAHVELSVAFDAAIEGWAKVLDLRDKETEGHTRRVTEMTLRLARKLEMSEAELVNVRRGALLHDIGKMGISDDILQKVQPLTDEEWAILRRHPENAHEWLAPISYLRPALDIPYSHHEKWDGTGYPRGIARDQIPLAARIFAAVDIWDALRFDRPYRKGWPDDKVIEHIRSLSGTHLDPQVVEVFLQTLAEANDAQDASTPRQTGSLTKNGRAEPWLVHVG